MSMKIERDITGSKFSVKLYKIRGKEKIENLEELTTAISHYFSIEPHHTENKSNCPLCKAMARETARKAR